MSTKFALKFQYIIKVVTIVLLIEFIAVFLLICAKLFGPKALKIISAKAVHQMSVKFNPGYEKVEYENAVLKISIAIRTRRGQVPTKNYTIPVST